MAVIKKKKIAPVNAKIILNLQKIKLKLKKRYISNFETPITLPSMFVSVSF